MIAHTLNNGIAASLTYSQSLARHLGADGRVLDWKLTLVAAFVCVAGIALVAVS